MTKKISKISIRFVMLLIITTATNAQTQQEQLDPLDLLLSESGEFNRPTKTADIPATSEVDTAIALKPAQHHLNTLPNYNDNLLWLSSANFASSFEQLSLGNTSNNDNKITIAADHNLIEAQIAAPVTKDDHQAGTLQQMIERVRSIKFEPREESPEPAVEKETISNAEPNDADIGQSNPDVAEQQESQQPQIEQEQTSPNDVISKPVLNQIKLLTEHPEQAKNPMLLAEVLALSGHHEQAAIMYCEALRRSTEDQPLSIHDKAWLLLQTASCQKTHEAGQALKTYEDLLTQCQGSPWVPVAQVQSDLLNWLQTEKPQELIELCKSELNMATNQESEKQKNAQ